MTSGMQEVFQSITVTPDRKSYRSRTETIDGVSRRDGFIEMSIIQPHRGIFS
jgi:hypothetical protein